jgi:hypothetical protein
LLEHRRYLAKTKAKKSALFRLAGIAKRGVRRENENTRAAHPGSEGMGPVLQTPSPRSLDLALRLEKPTRVLP